MFRPAIKIKWTTKNFLQGVAPFLVANISRMINFFFSELYKIRKYIVEITKARYLSVYLSKLSNIYWAYKNETVLIFSILI